MAAARRTGCERSFEKPCWGGRSCLFLLPKEWSCTEYDVKKWFQGFHCLELGSEDVLE
jgi:hypothetical protein